MDRINHVKIVSPDPAAVDRFLQEVVQVPAGWPLGSLDGYEPPAEVRGPARAADGALTMESIMAFRGPTQAMGGHITGDPSSRQFQIFQGDEPKVWGVAIGTRDLEGAPRGAWSAASRAPTSSSPSGTTAGRSASSSPRPAASCSKSCEPSERELRVDVRNVVTVEPEVEHNGTVPVWWLIKPEEMKAITDGGYLELANEFEVAVGGEVFPHTHPTHEFYFVMTGVGHHDHRRRAARRRSPAT